MFVCVCMCPCDLDVEGEGLTVNSDQVLRQTAMRCALLGSKAIVILLL